MVPLLREGKPMETVEACTLELMNRLAQIKKRPARRNFLEELPAHLRKDPKGSEIYLLLFSEIQHV